MKATEKYFHAVSVYYVVQDDSNFMSVDETLVCGHSNESYRAVLSCGTVY